MGYDARVGYAVRAIFDSAKASFRRLCFRCVLAVRSVLRSSSALPEPAW
jgi:hypothetical protein